MFQSPSEARLGNVGYQVLVALAETTIHYLTTMSMETMKYDVGMDGKGEQHKFLQNDYTYCVW